MPKHFMKTIACGCVIRVLSVGTKLEDNKVLYLIGGHDHIKICEKCREDESDGIDTLWDMWKNDCYTDGTENDGWKKLNYIYQDS
jgi:hypothetical protein